MALRVLVVGNEMNRDMLSKRLQRRGLRVDTARRPEAQAMIALERYEIVLLDLVLWRYRKQLSAESCSRAPSRTGRASQRNVETTQPVAAASRRY